MKMATVIWRGKQYPSIAAFFSGAENKCVVDAEAVKRFAESAEQAKRKCSKKERGGSDG
jgi:hypothetical protein